MANEVKIEISLEEKQAIDALTKLIKKTDDLNDNVKKNAKESTAAWNVFKGSIAADVVGKGFDLIGKGAKELFKTFILDGIKASAEWKKFKDGVTDYIAKNDTVLRLQEELSKAFVKMSQVVKENEAAIKAFIHNAVIFAVDTFVVLVRSLDYLVRGFQVIPEAVNIAGQAMITGLLAPMVMVVDGINAVIESVPMLKEKFGTVGEGLKEIFEASSGSAVESIDKIEKKFGESTFLSGIADAAAGVSVNLEAKKNDPANDPDVVYEQQKQAILTQLREEAALIEGELKMLREEEAMLENEAKLANIEEQAALEQQARENAESMKLASEAKTKEQFRALDMKFEKENSDRKLKEAQKAEQLRQQELQRESQYRQALNGIANNFLNAGIALAKDGSATMKALQTTQAIVNTYTGATNALADTRPAFLAPVAAASIIALGLANVAKINGAKFQTGGFVGGSSIAGDQNIIRANSDEFVATRAQQRNMIEAMANGSATNRGNETQNIINAAFSQPIVVQVDGREIARATRSSLKEGFLL